MMGSDAQRTRGCVWGGGWLGRLAPLVGRLHRDDSSDECWLLVREALCCLGVEMPVKHGACASMGLWVRPLRPLRQLDLGDVLIFRRDDECAQGKGDHTHVGLCLGDGRALHSERPSSRIEPIATIEKRMRLQGAVRLKIRPWRNKETIE